MTRRLGTFFSFESGSKKIDETDLFYYNQRFKDLKTADIKKYIRKEIVPFTKNTPIFEPKNASSESYSKGKGMGMDMGMGVGVGTQHTGNHSSLCIII